MYISDTVTIVSFFFNFITIISVKFQMFNGVNAVQLSSSIIIMKLHKCFVRQPPSILHLSLLYSGIPTIYRLTIENVYVWKEIFWKPDLNKKF